MTIENLKSILNQKIGQKDLLKNKLKDLKLNQKESRISFLDIEKAQIIIQSVAKDTQNQITEHISDLVSMALAAVFPDPYEFNIEFVKKRGKTEAEISFIRNGEKINPMQASGGGAVDIASFALRVALWSLQRPKTSNTIILDEPMKFLSKNMIDKAGEMIKLLSEKLKIQFIIVTHIVQLSEYADKIFNIENRKGISYV